MSITTLPYTLRLEPRLKWTSTQEKTICRDYPFFDLCGESAEQFVVRSYLQFLWLPESIMPLSLLVPSLLRVTTASTSQHPSDSTPHPLHALLGPLLLTPRASANKYHVDLPQILRDGGGAGEIEETMMWFTLTHEKTGSTSSDDAQLQEDGITSSTHGREPWEDERWRAQWLERLERREVQVQILLLFLILSLPGTEPTSGVTDAQASPRIKRRPSDLTTQKVEAQSTRDCLESFMDKLSMWQLMHGLEIGLNLPKAQNNVKKDERDWMQIFCEELVEKQFKSKCPNLCDLLRSKVFRCSPFSDTSATSSRPPSPSLTSERDGHHKQKRKRADSFVSNAHSRFASPALTNTSARRSAGSSHQNSIRSRSRSLSVTLAQDADERAARLADSASVAEAKKRVFSREVSMSRCFKAKGKEREKDQSAKVSNADWKGTTLAPNRRTERSENNKDMGVTLVAETPVKVKTKGRTLPVARPIEGDPVIHRDINRLSDVVEEEGIWDLPMSPDMFLKIGRGSAKQGGSGCSDESVLVAATPAKKRRR